MPLTFLSSQLRCSQDVHLKIGTYICCSHPKSHPIPIISKRSTPPKDLAGAAPALSHSDRPDSVLIRNVSSAGAPGAADPAAAVVARNWAGRNLPVGVVEAGGQPGFHTCYVGPAGGRWSASVVGRPARAVLARY
jgi:hypothetical protein